MARISGAFVAADPSCAYLPEETSHTEILEIEDLSEREYATLLRRGWRRFGNRYFHPRCPACSACKPIRIPVASFRPSKDQRRAASRCADVEVSVGPPRVTPDRIDLYNRWHAWRERSRGWLPSPIDAGSYERAYARPLPWAREMAYRIGGQLAGTGLVDVTGAGISSVFFYFDPGLAHLSLGTFGALAEIGYAAGLGLPHLYLGYWVAGCPSLAYKARFRPHEILEHLPAGAEEPEWIAGGERVTQPSRL